MPPDSQLLSEGTRLWSVQQANTQRESTAFCKPFRALQEEGVIYLFSASLWLVLSGPGWMWFNTAKIKAWSWTGLYAQPWAGSTLCTHCHFSCRQCYSCFVWEVFPPLLPPLACFPALSVSTLVSLCHILDMAFACSDTNFPVSLFTSAFLTPTDLIPLWSVQR